MKHERGGIELVEEAIRLLRRTPARLWLLDLSGAIPFFSALIWFIWRMTGNLRAPDPTGGSLMLAVLFGFRQATRSLFAVQLYERVSGSTAARRSGVWFRATFLSMAAGFLRMLFIGLPIPYFSSLFRLLGMAAWTDESPGKAFQRAAHLAGRGGSQFIGTLLIAAAMMIFWINFFALIAGSIVLFQTFTGAEIALTRNVQALFSWPFLASSFVAGWLLTDAVLAAFHALQRFYGESQETGADILRNWHAAWTRAAAASVLLLSVCGVIGAAAPPDLNTAIDQVLTQPQYQWREPPPLSMENQNPVMRVVRSFAEGIQSFFRRAFRPVRRLWDRFMRWLRGIDFKTPDVSATAPPVSLLRLLTAVGIVLLAGVLAAFLLRMRMGRRLARKAGAAGPAIRDLSDPTLAATDLPEQEWLRLAGEHMNSGDARSALRALFLAMLSHLATRNLVAISRYKSNRDYQGELSRRARGIAGLEALFATSARRVESAWYGMSPVDRPDVEQFMSQLERMRAL